jgi:hypothetical protein
MDRDPAAALATLDLAARHQLTAVRIFAHGVTRATALQARPFLSSFFFPYS